MDKLSQELTAIETELSIVKFMKRRTRRRLPIVSRQSIAKSALKKLRWRDGIKTKKTRRDDQRF